MRNRSWNPLIGSIAKQASGPGRSFLDSVGKQKWRFPPMENVIRVRKSSALWKRFVVQLFAAFGWWKWKLCYTGLHEYSDTTSYYKYLPGMGRYQLKEKLSADWLDTQAPWNSAYRVRRRNRNCFGQKSLCEESYPGWRRTTSLPRKDSSMARGRLASNIRWLVFLCTSHVLIIFWTSSRALFYRNLW